MGADDKILLVDDYKVNRIMAQRHLESAGYAVDLAGDGSQAIDAFQVGRYGLVLMDIEMPVLDGWECTNRIRSLEIAATPHAPSRVPIIAMSGHVHKDDVESYRRAGMDDCLAKPIKRDSLLAIVQKWLDRSCVPASKAATRGRIAEEKNPSIQAALPIDMQKAIDEFMGDAEMVRCVLLDFVRTGIEQLATIEQAVKTSDFEQIRFEAHALKGGAANLTAYPLADRCAGIEEAAEAASPADGQRLLPLFKALKSEFNRLTAFVDRTDPLAGNLDRS